MKKLLLTILLLTASGEVLCQQRIQGYIRKDGTMVDGHFRTRPNGTALDNYSTSGNWNPNSGTVSNRRLDIPTTRIDDLEQRTTHIGPRGGRYHIGGNGQKIYDRKN